MTTLNFPWLMNAQNGAFWGHNKENFSGFQTARNSWIKKWKSVTFPWPQSVFLKYLYMTFPGLETAFSNSMIFHDRRTLGLEGFESNQSMSINADLAEFIFALLWILAFFFWKEESCLANTEIRAGLPQCHNQHQPHLNILNCNSSTRLCRDFYLALHLFPAVVLITAHLNLHFPQPATTSYASDTQG